MPTVSPPANATLLFTILTIHAASFVVIAWKHARRNCVEACPTDAITHGHGFELAPYDINSLVYRKEQMLEKDILPNAPVAR